MNFDKILDRDSYFDVDVRLAHDSDNNALLSVFVSGIEIPETRKMFKSGSYAAEMKNLSDKAFSMRFDFVSNIKDRHHSTRYETGSFMNFLQYMTYLSANNKHIMYRSSVSRRYIIESDFDRNMSFRQFLLYGSEFISLKLFRAWWGIYVRKQRIFSEYGTLSSLVDMYRHAYARYASVVLGLIWWSTLFRKSTGNVCNTRQG